MIQQLLSFYKGKQAEISEQHRGEFVLIHSREIIGYYPTAKAAYWHAIDDKKFKPGQFLIRECVPVEEETPLTFYSRVR